MKKEKTLFLLKLTEPGRDTQIVIKPDEHRDVTLHSHDFFELAYVTGGSAEHTLNGQVSTVRKGDYFIVDYGSTHSYCNTKDFSLINCMFLPELIDDTLADCRVFEELLRIWLIRYYKSYYGLHTVNRVFRDESGDVQTLLLKMQEEYEKSDMGYAEILRGKLLEILILTMRKVAGEQTISSRKSPESNLVQETIRYMKLHYRDRAVLQHFCDTFHYSPQYISRKFKQETGMTILEYLQRMRVEKCCELLEGSEKTVQEIAREVGYEDIKFFHKVFRKMLHMSPGEYRKLSKS